jgi:hypothetical protein
MSWENIFTVYLKKRRDSLRDRGSRSQFKLGPHRFSVRLGKQRILRSELIPCVKTPNYCTLISTLVIATLVMTVMLFGMGKITPKVMITAGEKVPVVMVGLWPLYAIGPLHFLFFQ